MDGHGGRSGPWPMMAVGVTWTLTALRIALIPLFLVVASRIGDAVVQGEEVMTLRAVALGTLLAMGLSDILDGYLARRWRITSRAGAIADAAADKGAQVAVLGYFALASAPGFWNVPLWFLALLVARDLLTLLGGAVVRAARGDIPVEHASHGRLASVLIFLLLVSVTAGLPDALLYGLLWASAAAVVVSTALYGLRALRWSPEEAAAGSGPKASRESTLQGWGR